ncbi:MAG: hypothetical protein Q8L86_08385 [Vicinamibacterales bacterium]|nr:hypothetical protein [Vicinamibacterales bacterium]
MTGPHPLAAFAVVAWVVTAAAQGQPSPAPDIFLVPTPQHVADRVRIIEGDLKGADLSEATVVTLYLSTSLTRALEPKLRAELRPGTRIVSHQFRMGAWTPDAHVTRLLRVAGVPARSRWPSPSPSWQDGSFPEGSWQRPEGPWPRPEGPWQRGVHGRTD